MKGWLMVVRTFFSVFAYLSTFRENTCFLFRTFIANLSGFPSCESFSTRYTWPKLPLPSLAIGLKEPGPICSGCFRKVGDFYSSPSKAVTARSDVYFLAYLEILF